ncbi:MAG: mechanosensitive ion channel domain-containing protein [Acidobacteriota bacterium]
MNTARVFLLLVLGFAAATRSASARPSRETNEEGRVAAPAVVMVFNRPIVTFRVPLGANLPQDRAANVEERIRSLSFADLGATLRLDRVSEGWVVALGDRRLFTVTPGDVDPPDTEAAADEALLALERLREALRAMQESRSLEDLLPLIAQAVAETAVFLLLLAVLARLHRITRRTVPPWIVRRLPTGRWGNWAPASPRFTLRALRAVDLAVYWTSGLFLTYLWLVTLLYTFPYTRPWSAALGTFLINTLRHLALGVLHAVPGLFTALVILASARLGTRFVRVIFERVEAGKLDIPGIHADTATASRRIFSLLIWIFAIVAAYPFLPGSESPAFKGVSVMLGVLLSLGSGSIIGQVLSGLTLQYARALKPGEYVRVGDTEGTVDSMAMVSTSIRTPRGELVVIPNSVMAGNITINYSRLAEQGVEIGTSVTIGYDTPWRQVHAMLMMAADRTAGLRRGPRPRVQQSALADFYVEYTLLATIERPETRRRTLSALHANIQDVFNEYGVQIMSPNYEADREHPTWVPRERWRDAPGDRLEHLLRGPLPEKDGGD